MNAVTQIKALWELLLIYVCKSIKLQVSINVQRNLVIKYSHAERRSLPKKSVGKV